MHTHRHSDDSSALPAGDANYNQTHINTSSNSDLDAKNIYNTNNFSSVTLSKASTKSDDDFDVNEYFARLQCTRYVSAPLNSNIKEDQNANLQTEDNLEEINLNEDKTNVVDDVQQSITADIAQNFSQLPTVLPQVASAVFSSFSNMLSLKSREQTPDDRIQYNDGATNVQLGVPEDKVAPHNVVPQNVVPQNIAPPNVAPPALKEPPTVGTPSGYRITTKKKVYAQIPGLSSGDGHVHFPPSSTATYFAEANTANAHTASIPQVDSKTENVAAGFDTQYTILTPPTVIETQNQKELEETQSTFIVNPVAIEDKSDVAKIPTNFIVPSQESNVIPSMTEEKEKFLQQHSIQPTQHTLTQNSQPSTAIIPPPPMFSNLPRRDSQPSIGKSVLPPSVARRISASQPIIKPQAPTSVITHENLFVPILQPSYSTENVEKSYDKSFDFTSTFGTNHGTFQNIEKQNYVQTQNVPNINVQQSSDFHSNNAGIFDATVPVAVDDSKETYSSTEPSIPPSQPKPADAFVSPLIFNLQAETSNISSYPVASNLAHITSQEHIAPPSFYNPKETDFAPTLKQDKNVPPIHLSQIPQQFGNLPLEPSKLKQEPPKITGNPNYRMSKKKPQYYSGPIEGVGSISNNIKPIINPVESTSFQGALFTPDHSITATNTLYPDYSTSSVHESTPFDISKPAATESYPNYETQQQNPQIQPDYNTAFDLSRPTTEKYEQPQQESKGFGIIGSLKSKLSSIDINKIQNTVTTFFDPAYNATSINTDKPEKKQYGYQNVPGIYTNYPQSEGTTLEVFVPNVNREQTFTNPYSYQVDQTKQITQPQQYYPTQDYYVNQNQSQICPNSNYYAGWYDNYNQQQPQVGGHFQTSTNLTQEVFENNKIVDKTTSKAMDEMILLSKNTSYLEQDKVFQTKSPESQEQKQSGLVPEVTDLSYSLFDNQHPAQIASESNNDNLRNITLKTDHYDLNMEQPKPMQTTSDSSLKSFFDNPKIEFLPEAGTRRKSYESKNVSNNDISQSTSQPSLKSIFDNPPPVEKPPKQTDFSVDTTHGGYGSDFIGDVPKISQVFTDPSSKGFFDKQTSLVLPFAIKKPDDIKITPKDERSSGTVQLKRTEPVEDLPETNRNIDNVQHIQSVFGNKELISQTGQISDNFSAIKKSELNIPEAMLPPGILAKNNSEKRDNTTLPSVKISQETADLNTNAFSLFDSPHNVASVPLFNLSSISSVSLTGPLQDTNNITEIETKLEKVSLFQNEVRIDSQPTYNLFGNVGTVDIKEVTESQASDLNICETCREVNKPEEKEVDDLTTQLIENITAPIQLANPVEYPKVEDETIPEDKPDYSNQLTDISMTSENIIESMIIPPPVDVMEDLNVNNSILNYGWSTNEPHSSKALLDHDYNFSIDPNSIGFLQDKSLFFESIPTNACDEMKAEYRNSQEDTSLLTHQMSIPSATPEEDTKSDESGLDVHSIEQDAKKDFPIYEEFVIEPSETDDDKIEYREREKSSDDPTQDVDTFTNRVERFKQMGNTTDANDTEIEVRRESKTFELPTSTSPAITIASYFDTGNYAVENHYRNSITSPSSLSSFSTNTTKPMRIPPGFEEEYQRRLSGISSQDLLCAINNQISTYIPDTSKKAFAQDTTNVDDESITDSKVESMVEKLIDDDSSPKGEKLTPFSNIIEPDQGSDKDDKIVTNPIVEKTAKDETKPLPDPLNFFSSNVGSNEESEVYSNFSRLSSYFTTPPQPDHSKSFFELSQSQNHYRHKTNEQTFDSIQNNVKNFFETSNLNTLNIPQNNSKNIALIRDLSSSRNFNPNEDIVKTVNYFTVEYDLNNANEINIGEPININKVNPPKAHTKLFNENENFEFSKCKYCCDVTKSIKITENTDFKIKKCMDSNTCDAKDTNKMDSNKENVVKKSLSVNFCEQNYQDENDDKIIVIPENRTSSEYAPVKHHWFYQVDSEEKSIWRGFSVVDSRALENAFNSPDLNENTVVPTDGGRYDVNVMERLKRAVYWEDKPTNVMRCSWFYKGTTDARYVPYSESIAEKLEEEYIHGITTGEWHRRLVLPNNELVVMHGPAVMVHFLENSANDAFTSSPQAMMRPRVVRRGCAESEIEDTEPSSIDHLLLLCHGVGSACDMRFRPVEEVVEDFRATSLQLIQSHYKNSFDNGIVGRVEVLPISWHSSLHSGSTGVDKRLAAVTLESIPRLRNFTNDTILDVLFYTSPVFCQTIIDTVCSEMNRIYSLFKSRNPDFKGGVSLGGHSLGSVILYDLLCHQLPKVSFFY
ncbi:unnamed protein product [Euphydryas editha]|uniref:WWE domain-containing protein n=1 Tax=Euphydryas editha TaxID=104508 RepID=A0AAU9TBN2_EUPED|nr:unnamed protein product [Euphydryas editha]